MAAEVPRALPGARREEVRLQLEDSQGKGARDTGLGFLRVILTTFLPARTPIGHPLVERHRRGGHRLTAEPGKGHSVRGRGGVGVFRDQEHEPLLAGFLETERSGLEGQCMSPSEGSPGPSAYRGLQAQRMISLP